MVLTRALALQRNFFGVMESTFKEEEVFKELKVAVQKKPNDSQANARLALIYIKRGKFEQGKPLFDKVVKQDPSNGTGLLPELYVSLALYYGQNAIGDKEKEYYQKAEEYLRIVVDKYSDSEVYEGAQHYLGITYALQEKVELAIAIFEELIDAEDEEIRKQAAQILQRLKGSME